MKKASDTTSQNKNKNENTSNSGSDSLFNENLYNNNKNIENPNNNYYNKDSYRINLHPKKYSVTPKRNLNSISENNNNNSSNDIYSKKNSEDNNSFIKEFQDLMKEANLQPEAKPSKKTSENAPFYPFSVESSLRSNAKTGSYKPMFVNEFDPFENSNSIAKENSSYLSSKDKSAKEYNEKTPLGLGFKSNNSNSNHNNSAASSFGSEILFPKAGIISNKSSSNNNKNKNKIEFSSGSGSGSGDDEEILNDLLGITNDFNKANKKDASSSAQINKRGLIIQGTEGIDLSNLENKSSQTDNNDSRIKENTNFFNTLEKETNDLKRSNKENQNTINFYSGGAESAKKGDIGINKLFENIVKEEEKAQQKKTESMKQNAPKKPNFNYNDLNALDANIDSNLNRSSDKLDKELKRIPISLAQLETEKMEDAGEKKKKKVYYLK